MAFLESFRPKVNLTNVKRNSYPDGMERDKHIPDLISITEAAEMLDISRQAVHQMIQKGQLVGAQIGTTWVFRRVVVERLRDG